MDKLRIIVTSGYAYTDIDALACAIAYTELLRLLDTNAIAVLRAPFNCTISEQIKLWDVDFETKYLEKPFDKFVLVDISDPSYFETFVKVDDVIQIFDHHYGYETFWIEKLSKNSHIENVGSCATLIWEQYKKYNQFNFISRNSANLLYTSIISNTLYLKASITSSRDRDAIIELKNYINLPHNWVESYYSEIESKIIADPINAIKNDTKKLIINNVNFTIAQLELLNADMLVNNKNFIINIMSHFKFESGNWFLTIANIKEGNNYIITSSIITQNILSSLFNVAFTNNIGITDKLYLLKELIKILMQFNYN